MTPDLTEEETAALIRLLRNTIDEDRYPSSPRIQLLMAILGKFRPEPAREPLPPLKRDQPPHAWCMRSRSPIASGITSATAIGPLAC
jgi:hypothetical protein